jgi:hypothetical protein
VISNKDELLSVSELSNTDCLTTFSCILLTLPASSIVV